VTAWSSAGSGRSTTAARSIATRSRWTASAVDVLGGRTFEWEAGAPRVGDPRQFQVTATDTAGNGGPLSEAVTGVPDLTGLTQAQAAAALSARGFVVGTATPQFSGSADGTVIGQQPQLPAYAALGSAINLTIASHSIAHAPLTVKVATARVWSLSAHHRVIVARVATQAAGTMTATLRNAHGRTVASWTKRPIGAGATLASFRFAGTLPPAGRYVLRILIVADGQSKVVSIPIRVVATERMFLGVDVGASAKWVEVTVAGQPRASLEIGSHPQVEV